MLHFYSLGTGGVLVKLRYSAVSPLPLSVSQIEHRPCAPKTGSALMNWTSALQIVCSMCAITPFPNCKDVPGAMLVPGSAFMEPAMNRAAIEERIRSEFEAAVAAVENAPPARKTHEEKRLNRAVRRLYDLIGYGSCRQIGGR